MAVAPPPHNPSSSTYSARAVPQLGPPTAEFQAVRDDRPCPGWPPQHHRPLIAFGAAAGAISVPLLIVYAFIADDPDTARSGQNLLLSAGLLLAVLSGCCFIATLVVRAFDHAVIQGAEYGVGEVHGLESLHTELRGMDAHLSAGQEQTRGAVAQLPQNVHAQVGEVLEHLQRIEAAVTGLRDRVDAVERREDGDASTQDLLRGVAGWALDIDHRLAALHAGLRKGDEVAAPSPNGQRDSSPMELSDEAMRGYFLGFYDRQTNPDPDGN